MGWTYYEETTVYRRPKKQGEEPGPLALFFGLLFWVVVIGLIVKGCS